MIVFAQGFRLLFWVAGLAALVLIALWSSSVVWGVGLDVRWPLILWHGHEMIFGFIAAAIGGFLLTAVPNWTGQPGIVGRPLILVTALWLLGRVGIAFSSYCPAIGVAAVDLAFFPAIAFLVLPLLRRAKNRNRPLVAILGLLTLINLVFHVALGFAWYEIAERALMVAVDTVLLLLTVIGGRIIPAFTTSALRSRGNLESISDSVTLTWLAIGTMIAVIIVDAGWPHGILAAVLAAVAAVIHGLRLLHWRTLRILRDPIVWVLHAAYGWLVVGFALKSVALLSGAEFARFWLHALTVGTATLMILGVMTRAALGHTGRPLTLGRPIQLAYVLVIAAAVVRVFGPWIARGAYPTVILLAALLWACAFVLYLVVYTPILFGPRVDGKPG